LEVDRREIGRRIAYLQKQLEKVRAHRKRHRVRRRRAEIPIVALIGYTNAGKSTLLNRLSGSKVLVADKLFATLDPTTRRIALPDGQQVLMTDTVGFIQKLPTMLVAAFRATLEEIAEADLLLHVVDCTHPNARAQAEAVRLTLDQIEAHGLPMVTALNKTDMLSDRSLVAELAGEFDCAVPISARYGEGMDELLLVLEREMFESMSPIQALIPYKAGGLINLFHKHGVVERSEHKREGILIEGRLPNRYLVQIRPFAAESPE
jgi:GTP-binding protein HflX